MAPLGEVAAASAGLLGAILLGALWLAARGRAAAPAPTWDCGYAAPDARMQYTASSFGDGLVGLLAFALRPVVHLPRAGGAFHSHVPDTVLDRVVLPAFTRAGRALGLLRPLHRGSVHLYLVYILGALVALLFWR
jgi:hydrogenase-4 component B